MKHIFIANWKMNFSIENAILFCEKLISSKVAIDNIIICPPQIYLLTLQVKFPQIAFASQDVSLIDKEFGAFTGEVSAFMLKRNDINYAIIGHSERRKYFSENDNVIRVKFKNCLENDIIPILCIGENAIEREKGQYLNVIKQQLLNVLPIEISILRQLIIAYEPVWSIGTGITPTIDQIKEVIEYIYNIVKDNGLLENHIKLVYGGSVSSKNIEDILKISDISGALIGGASLDINEFIKICQIGE